MQKLIFIVDDEADILELLSISLKKEYYRTQTFATAKEFYAALEHQIPQLIILDLMLPDANGLDICKSIKSKNETTSIPVIVLTAKETETDKVLGLELGADDYITKPFSVKELCARVKAILRRGEKLIETQKASASTSDILRYKNILILNKNTYEVLVYDKPVNLTSTEFNILTKFLENPNWVFSRDELLEHLWGHSKIVNDRTIDVHIKHLRDKLKPADIIKNKRGVGYKLL